MKEIPLSGKFGKGLFTKVDDEDYEELNKWIWSLREGRVRRNAHMGKRGNKYYSKNMFMHRQIMNPPDGMVIDHINGDSLDNRKVNLRICTNQQNLANRGKAKGNKSGYKGVRLVKGGNHYSAAIMVNYKQIYLGVYSTVIDAAIGYNHAALKYFGEFAFFNDIPGWRKIFPKKIGRYKKLHQKNTSGYSNVAYVKEKRKWRAYIRVNKKTICIGYFNTVEEGAIAYNEAAIKYLGKNARLNPI